MSGAHTCLLGLAITGFYGAGSADVLAREAKTVFAVLKINAFRPDEEFDRAQLQLIKSRPTLQLTLMRPEISNLDLVRKHPDPIVWLERDLRIEFHDDILRIGLRGTEVHDLVSVVNAVTDVYLEQVRTETDKRFKHVLEDIALKRRLCADANLLRAFDEHARALAARREQARQGEIGPVTLVQKAQ
jgi:hypothetical protein